MSQKTVWRSESRPVLGSKAALINRSSSKSLLVPGMLSSALYSDANAKNLSFAANRNGFSPYRSRAQKSTLDRESYRANANMPLKRERQSVPHLLYASTTTSVSDLSRKIVPKRLSSSPSSR